MNPVIILLGSCFFLSPIVFEYPTSVSSVEEVARVLVCNMLWTLHSLYKKPNIIFFMSYRSQKVLWITRSSRLLIKVHHDPTCIGYTYFASAGAPVVGYGCPLKLSFFQIVDLEDLKQLDGFGLPFPFGTVVGTTINVTKDSNFGSLNMVVARVFNWVDFDFWNLDVLKQGVEDHTTFDTHIFHR